MREKEQKRSEREKEKERDDFSIYKNCSAYLTRSIHNISVHLLTALLLPFNQFSEVLKVLHMRSEAGFSQGSCNGSIHLCLFCKYMWLLKPLRTAKENKTIIIINWDFCICDIIRIIQHNTQIICEQWRVKLPHSNDTSGQGVIARVTAVNYCCGQTSCPSRVQQLVSSILCSLPERQTQTKPQLVKNMNTTV